MKTSEEHSRSPYLTTVVDVGARYGMHPAWSGFDGEMRYLAFEPDAEEAERLRQNNDPKVFEVIEAAVFNREGMFDFNLLVHRGMSSFLVPDLESEAFKDLKPGLGNIERVIKIQTRPLDLFVTENQWPVDFIKVDTEGTEHEVIESGREVISDRVLGVRSSINFNPAFHGQTLFSTTHDFLLAQGFMLLNIDYFGYGYPKLGLFKKPDPNVPESQRYGVLVGCDAVWIRRPNGLPALGRCRDAEGLESSTLKLAFFCLLNNAPDVAADILHNFCTKQGGWTQEATLQSRLFKSLQAKMLEYLGRWRTVPDESWDRARNIYRVIYGKELQGGSGFYPQYQALMRDLASGE